MNKIYTNQQKKYVGVPVDESLQKDFIATRDMLKLPYVFPF